MKPFQPATVPEAEVRVAFLSMSELWAKGDTQLRQTFPADNLAEAEKLIHEFLAKERLVAVFRNDVYQVQKREDGDWVSLSIKRIDREPIHDWRDLQEIKNQLLGAEVEAIELYPAESRLVDTANQYFLWATPVACPKFPFGFNEGRRVSQHSIGKSVNRPREEAQP